MNNIPIDEYETTPGQAGIGRGQSTDPSTASTTDVAKDQAAQVSQSAKESGMHVAKTAADEASNVAVETRRQAKHLGQEVTSQVQQQAALQKDKAASGLHSLGAELRSMAQQGGQSGPATDLAQQAADKVTDLAAWLEHRDPGSLLEEVRTYARRKPGTFLLGAAAAGVLAGRLTRGAVQVSKEGADASGDGQSAPGSDGPRRESGEYAQTGAGTPPDIEQTTPIADLAAAETGTNGFEPVGRTR
jgi:hypothetical protein